MGMNRIIVVFVGLRKLVGIMTLRPNMTSLSYFELF
jgi:hypothetical protein